MTAKPLTIQEMNEGIADILDRTPVLDAVDEQHGSGPARIDSREDAWEGIGNRRNNPLTTARIRAYLDLGHEAAIAHLSAEAPEEPAEAPVSGTDKKPEVDFDAMRENLQKISLQPTESKKPKVGRPIARAHVELGRNALPGIKAELQASIARQKENKHTY